MDDRPTSSTQPNTTLTVIFNRKVRKGLRKVRKEMCTENDLSD